MQSHEKSFPDPTPEGWGLGTRLRESGSGQIGVSARSASSKILRAQARVHMHAHLATCHVVELQLSWLAACLALVACLVCARGEIHRGESSYVRIRGQCEILRY